MSADAAKENLTNWYYFDQRVDGKFAIAIAQRSNAAWSERLLKVNANIWLMTTISWATVAVVVGLVVGLSLEEFLLGVAFPLLPALLDVIDEWRSTRAAGEVRRAMADGIERSVRGQADHELSGEDLLAWQGQLYDLRRNAPQVPDLVYKRTRNRNEQAMVAAASQLTEIALQRQTDNGGAGSGA